MKTIMYTPLVSVVMPAYNASQFIEEAVQSVLDQSYKNIELIVVDDGSTDDTVSKISSFNDRRLKVISQLNQGACVARNRGLQESKGAYIKFLDADDILCTEAIDMQVRTMHTLAKDEEVFGDFDFIDADGNVFHHSTVSHVQTMERHQDEWLLYNWKMLTSCPLHRKELLEQIGGFDVRLQGGQEGMLHFAMSIAGVKFVYRPGTIYQYRIHQDPNRISIQREDMMPDFADRVYYFDKIYSLIQGKYGLEISQMTHYLVQRYFNFALRFYASGADNKGNYFIQWMKEIPHTNKFPKYCGSSRLAMVYLSLIRLLGYRRAEKIVNRLVKLLGLRTAGTALPSPVCPPRAKESLL